MKKILITGSNGFVGTHFIKYCQENFSDWSIEGIGRSANTNPAINYHQINLLEKETLKKLIEKIKPDYVLHLASLSSVADSWQNPETSFVNNTNIFLNLIEAIRLFSPQSKILSIGSSEEYGIVKPENLPLKENDSAKPANPYAVARVAQENLSLIYASGFKLNLCCTRSFNHIGPGQNEKFVFGSLIKQFARIHLKESAPVISIGDGSIIRDFTDVRDVVRAYGLLLQKGEPGQLYNVCSEVGYSITQIIQLASKILDIPVEIKKDPKLVRPIDNPRIIGSYQKLMGLTQWKPKIELKQTIIDMFEDYLIKEK